MKNRLRSAFLFLAGFVSLALASAQPALGLLSFDLATRGAL